MSHYQAAGIKKNMQRAISEYRQQMRVDKLCFLDPVRVFSVLRKVQKPKHISMHTQNVHNSRAKRSCY